MSALNNNESNSNGISTTNLTKISNNSQREATASPVSTTTQSNKGQNSINNSNDATNALLNDALNFKNLPKEYSSYIDSLDAAKERLTSDKPLPLDYIYPYLESSLLNCPDSYDADKSRKYNPINPYQTQSFFPQEPVVEIVGSTKLLTKLEVETLAYCFYYNSQHYKSPLITSQQEQQQTDSTAKEESDNEKSEDIEPPISSNDYLQYITAKEFRNRGWKYHKELHTWFHKAEEDPTEAAPPIGLSNSNGNGDSWKYFDYRDTWMIRRKDEFSFDGNLEETDYFNN
ncbi:unnamed protein product [[Candida] boidinii]|uniref:Unnamed protein product n=1 Tax=Candida boidinii TaxID=5477 RepID=A0ACB5TZU7_CANBO|nr:unnamed protein product [[Candida] boidinii]GME98505.1 unnamed protein product [[Candida] boidinii]